MDKDAINNLTESIIGMAMKVHRTLGPGFVEKIYEKALACEFECNNVNYERQFRINVIYEGVDVGEQRVDFIIESEVILELKSVSEIQRIHEAQLLSYLKAANKKVGLILNFANKSLEIKRMVNKL